jgi:hypothetical protein
VAVHVAQAHVAQRHFLDQAAFPGHLDDVALAHLVFEQQEEAGEVVLDQALRAEADRHARHAGGGEDRRHRDAELAEHQRAGDDDDDDRSAVAEDAGERLDARLLVGARRLPLHVAPEDADQAVRGRLQQPREAEDEDDPQRGDRGGLRLGVELVEVVEERPQ